MSERIYFDCSLKLSKRNFNCFMYVKVNNKSYALEKVIYRLMSMADNVNKEKQEWERF